MALWHRTRIPESAGEALALSSLPVSRRTAAGGPPAARRELQVDSDDSEPGRDRRDRTPPRSGSDSVAHNHTSTWLPG